MKITVHISITERVGYETRDVAACKLETEAAWEGITRAIDGVLEDVTERVAAQVKAEHKRIAAKEAALEDTNVL